MKHDATKASTICMEENHDFEGRDMKTIKITKSLLRVAQSIVFILTLGATLSACSSMTWKEEVLLHDGNKIIVTRTNTYDPKGLRELGQPDPLKESTLTFTVPGTKQTVTWKSDFGRAYQDNLVLYMIDILNNIPYIVTTPGGCMAYNKWGRPNPPYVFFKYENEWKRILLEQFPAEFKELNVILAPDSNEHKKRKIQNMIAQDGFVSVENIKKLNRDSGSRALTRAEVTTAKTTCPKMMYYKDAWISSEGDFGRKFVDSISK
ncbi:MAG: hypothetical protein NUV55_01075 [Sulfuricaulis sp.]|uniref:hypothetical protein n=1 Tax=Sulfuricaulis sp. TaxID=2003553 RepID=UPI0025E0F1ED|nr:hypothetical protein [Sulfuricaulis sp.]MCR4345788.1 hypothetical protein [Sulfuricaulis sp.]